MINPLLPVPQEEERLRAAQREEIQYRCIYECVSPDSPIENVRFRHNPNWQSEPEFFSISGIRNKPNWFWKIIGGLFMISQFGYWGLRGIF